jgi:cystathionine beta-synthase
MEIAPDILSVIGRTPMVRLSRLAAGLRASVVAKLEMLNPGGSVKDRIGLLMIEDAERRGLLRPGGTIVEPTSGNTGVGLAMAAAIKGYRLVCTMADKQSQEKRDLLRAFGAEVVVCPTAVPPDSPDSYYKVAERLARELPGGFLPDQYHNPRNPEAHYRTTGPEIWEQTEGRLTHFVTGVGTGGTVTGAGRYLKERNPALQIVGADPEGSIYTGAIHPYKTEGIGEDFYPGTFDPALVDRWVRVSDRDSFLAARRLVREEAILAGGSAGTALVAALEVAKDLDERALVVVLLPDSGRSYLSKVFNDEWMRQNGFLDRFPLLARVADVMKDREPGTPELIVVSKSESVRNAIDTMQRYGISQIPVVADGSATTVSDIVGSVQEKTMLDRVFREPALVDERVERQM